MAYIFMDESGDLGFDKTKAGCSNNFLITFFLCNNPSPFEKIVGKTFRSMPEDKQKKHCGTLHACHEHPKTKLTLYKLLKEKKDFSIMVIRLNKANVYTNLQNEKNVLYNYITNILLDRIISKKLCNTREPIYFVASQKDTNKYLNSVFMDYISSQVKNRVDLKLEIKSSSKHKCLQIVDFLSWGIFQKYEHNDESYYENIKEFIVEDYLLFK
jgi:hypothetical protein